MTRSNRGKHVKTYKRRSGRVLGATLASLMVFAVAWSPLVGKFPTVFQGISAAICYIAPPITAVFVLGVFWRRASAAGSITTLVLGFVLGLAVFFLDWFKKQTGWDVPFMMAGFYLFCLCCLVHAVVSLLRPDPPSAERDALVWTNPMQALRDPGWPGLGNYKLLAGLLCVVMIALYAIFH